MGALDRHYTPPALAAQLVRRALAPLRGRAATVCDPACGDGALLVEARRFLGDRARLFGADIDPGAVARARARLAGADIRCFDALRPGGDEWEAWGEFDAVIGNPPWISFSGRHARPLLDEDRDHYAASFETFLGWRCLHGLFVELSVRISRGRVGLLLPAQVGDLAGYGAVRAYVRRHCAVEPAVPFGEGAFEGVTQPCAAFLFERRPGGEPGGRTPFPCGTAAAGAGRNLRSHSDLGTRRRVRSSVFGDIGVHTGNCARKLLEDGGIPIRVGRDVHAYRLGAPSRCIVPDPPREEGDYFRLGPLPAYRAVPILLRQTADRPIAALHTEPTYFRNSVLACRGFEGVPDELVVAWLNSSAVATYHRRRVREASQRAFPQLKIRHLRDLPVPDWSAAPPGLVDLARAVARQGRIDRAGELDERFGRWFSGRPSAHRAGRPPRPA